MGSDRARRSYDPGRKYRSVVSQQGRVTLEADGNEAEEIRAEEARADLIDVIGPAGSPNDGFKISAPVPGGARLDLGIAAGTLYVGGNRVTTEQTTYFSQQKTEWLDYAEPPPADTKAFKELVYLSLCEQEVSATEDDALREVALGGPDTAARTRLVQRVQRAHSTGSDCPTALTDVEQRLWTPAGSVLDETTMRLTSTLQLKVEPMNDPTPADDCQPTQQLGFRGAENQLVRVQIAGDGQVLWGYDNASFLYRGSILDASTLQLDGVVVDAFHTPRQNQWVEVLRPAVALDGSATIAAATGFARQLAADYDPDTPALKLQSALPDPFVQAVGGGVVFLRMWESQLALGAPGVNSTELQDHEEVGIGLSISIRTTPGETFAPVPGDYWLIGVRPSAPVNVYPARLKADFQPPDGPRRWVTPLAFVSWNDDLVSATVSDCRPRFRDLVDLSAEDSGCCELLISPGDNVQAKVDERLTRNFEHNITSLHVRFASGTFTLLASLVLQSKQGGDITVSGCGLGSKLLGAGEEVTLVLVGWNTASVSDLTVAANVAQPGHGKKHRDDVFPLPPSDEFRHLGGAITFLDCQAVTVERVAATCGRGDRRAASCINVRNNTEPGTVRVRSCTFAVSPQQVGVLVVNAARATIDDNQVALAGSESRTNLSAGNINRTVGYLTSNLRIGDDSQPGPADGTRAEVAIPIGQKLALRFTTSTQLAKVLPKVLLAAKNSPVNTLRELLATPEGSTPKNLTAATRKALPAISALVRSAIEQAQGSAVAAPLRPADRKAFSRAVGEAISALALAAGQGIVVAGEVATDVRVKNNTLVNVMDGIHVGVSRREATPGTPLQAGHVQIDGNTISVRLPHDQHGAHAGVFVGNAHNCTIRDNQVDVELGNTESLRRADGIRVWGALGSMLQITGNATSHAAVGIHVVVTGTPISPPLWLIADNQNESATTTIVSPTGATVARNQPP